MIMAVVIVLGVVVVIEVLAAWCERGLKWSRANLEVINLMAVAVVSCSEDWEDSAQGVGGDDDLHGCPLFGSGFDGVLLLALMFTVTVVVMVVLELECCRGEGGMCFGRKVVLLE